MQTAMVVTWREPFPGREMKALEYGMEVQAFWTEHAEAGRCSVPELFFSDRGTGMWMVKGDEAELQAIQATDAGQQLFVRGQLCLEGFSLDWFRAGDAVDAYMARYAEVAAAL
jgi:hypothetical protein